jgi:hypothetical protein
MSDAIETGVWRRMRYTPLRDAIRGRISGRLDVAALVAGSGLALPTRELILRVVRRTRLWRIERVEVANELIAHFADGLASGASTEELMQTFGDEKQAARLIRRSMIRKRPIAWHVLRGLVLMLLILIAIYALLMGRFFIGRPTPTVNYLSVLNEPALMSSQSDRAWPIYRGAMLSIHGQDQKLGELARALPHQRTWPELERWLLAHPHLLEQIRHAASKPQVGFVLGPSGDAYDAQLYPDRTAPAEDSDQSGQSLIEVMLPYLNEMRFFANLLAADARLALQQDDAERFEQNLVAMLGIAAQMRSQSPMLIADLVSLAIRGAIIDEVERALVDRPQLLSDDQLQRLAHHLARPGTAPDLVSLSSERMAFQDLAQRIYTDDGRGDGRLTPQGLRVLHGMVDENREIEAVAFLALPLFAASRREVLEIHDRLISRADGQLALPLREANWQPFDDEVERWSESLTNQMQYVLLRVMMPSLSNLHATVERYLGRRDAIVTALALEAYRRQHGAYPSTLDELTPALLPAVPADRIDGQPLRYRLVEGKPLLYSVGADRQDDGGELPLNRADSWRMAAAWGIPASQAVAGDWLLFPSPAQQEDGEEEEQEAATGPDIQSDNPFLLEKAALVVDNAS